MKAVPTKRVARLPTQALEAAAGAAEVSAAERDGLEQGGACDGGSPGQADSGRGSRSAWTESRPLRPRKAIAGGPGEF